MVELEKQRCGFVSITGLPNSGKSTLLNGILNEKISIISKKVQTTQKAIKGIFSKGIYQIIFIDTPGMPSKKSYLDKSISRSIYHSANESNLNIFVHDAKKEFNSTYFEIIFPILRQNKKNIMVINKIDLVDKKNLITTVQKSKEFFLFNEILFVSAKKKKGLNQLKKIVCKYLPAKKWIFNNEQSTDHKLEFLLSEITREKIFQLLNQELPYKINIKTKIIKNKVFQNIFVNKTSQKPIFIGKNGEKIKQIGIRSRKEIEKKLNKKIYLELKVKLKK